MLSDERTDRRAALRERTRRAIVDAAAALMDEAGGVTFTVDQLADRADVSRRTIFNHFASTDDVVTAVCSDLLGSLIDTFVSATAGAPAPDGDRASLFDEMAYAIRATDLVTPVIHLTRTLGLADERSPWRGALLLRAFTDVSASLGAAMVRRHPDSDPLEVDLLIGALMSGITVVHQHWVARTGGADDDASRELWTTLLDRVIDTTRTGYHDPTGP